MICLNRTVPKGMKEEDFTRLGILAKMQYTAPAKRVPGINQLQSTGCMIYRKLFDDCEITLYKSGYVIYSETRGKKRTDVFFLPKYYFYKIEGGKRLSGEEWDRIPFIAACFLIGSMRVGKNRKSGADARERYFDETIAGDNLYTEGGGFEESVDLYTLLETKKNTLSKHEIVLLDRICQYPDESMSDRAKALGIPRTTLNSRLGQIRKKLAELKEYI